MYSYLFTCYWPNGAVGPDEDEYVIKIIQFDSITYAKATELYDLLRLTCKWVLVKEPNINEYVMGSSPFERY